ncbi:hypothetical protein JXL21_09810 [Candidatus Bathyarchaeota archaeon]|nr:hypothetical protein [Candidatus Bathyarchaeota archaeon]
MVYEAVIIGFFGYFCLMALRRHRRTRSRVDLAILVGSIYSVAMYIFVTASFYMNPAPEPVTELTLSTLYYSVGFIFLGSLVFYFHRVESVETHLESLVEERTRQLVEARRLADIGRGVGLAGKEIRNYLVLVNQSSHLAESGQITYDQMHEIIRRNIAKIMDALEALRQGRYSAAVNIKIDDVLAETE